jgi:KDO2-lipid IV(A) lauroyltransferase
MFLNFNFKKIRYALEAPLVWLGIVFFRSLKIENASNLAGKIAIFIGKKIAVNKLAMNNLAKALPHLDSSQKNAVINDMWDNLGRVIGEFPHVCKMSADEILQHVEIDENSRKILDELIAKNQGGIIFSAHFGNWEIGPKILINYGLKVKTFYRPLNNPFVEKMTSSLRGVEMIEKGSEGNRQLITALKNKEFILIMADQKVSDGEPIKFFHDKAITATAIAKIALKYNVPLVPGFILRVNKQFKFLLKVEKPLEFNKINSLNSEATNLTLKINQIIEKWVGENPEQWFWVHNRWKK